MNGSKIRIGVIAILLVAMFAIVPSAQAAQDLRITDYNLNSLQNWGTWMSYGSGELLVWEGYPGILDVNYQKLKMVGTIRATTVADNKGRLYGECVSLVKALSKSNVVTDNWQKGDNVLFSVWQGSPARPGEVIATFDSNGKYKPGHAAIFRSYIFGSSGKITGIKVWDQNYLPPPPNGGVVARHDIRSKGTTYSTDPTNADNYYTVRVP